MLEQMTIMENNDDYINRRMNALKNELLLAKNRVKRLEMQLNDLKRLRTNQTKTLNERLMELFVASRVK